MRLLHQLEELLQYSSLYTFDTEHGQQLHILFLVLCILVKAQLLWWCHLVVTIAFPTILLSTSPAYIDHNPSLMSNGTRRWDREASRVFERSFSMNSFYIVLAMVEHKSVELSANYLVVRILFQSSSSTLKVQNQFCFSVEACELSAWIFSYLIWWILSDWSGKTTSSVVLTDLVCFYFNSPRLVSVRGRIPFSMLLVMSLIALSTLFFCICCTKFFQSCAMVLGALTCLRLLRKVSAILGMIIAVFNAIFFNGESFTHPSINLVSSIKHLSFYQKVREKYFYYHESFHRWMIHFLQIAYWYILPIFT